MSLGLNAMMSVFGSTLSLTAVAWLAEKPSEDTATFANPRGLWYCANKNLSFFLEPSPDSYSLTFPHHDFSK
jgi:hypothetical protein